MSKAIKDIWFHIRLTQKVDKILLKNNFQLIKFHSDYIEQALRIYEKKEAEVVGKAELFITEWPYY